MMNIEDIRIVRLKTGEDIIGTVTDIDDMRFSIRTPMMVEIHRDMKTLQQSFLLASWLPHQLYKDNEVSIWSSDVLFVSEPTEFFVEYYSNMVSKLEEYIEADNFMNKLKDDELYQALNEIDESTIH